jgi:predicted phage baseplate assembly protein
MRKTSLYAQSEELSLAELKVKDPIEGNSIVLDRAIELTIGQIIAISGKVVDDKNQEIDLVCSEISIIAEAEIDANTCTKITFEHCLQNRYVREGLVINANVAKANHGQTKALVLGGGDPSRYLQQFTLREKPLTYISSATATGIKSTLEISVNDIKWAEAPSLFNLGPTDRSYITRIDNDHYTHIIFGDGLRGLRPEAGLDNIKVKYRVGIGKESLQIKPGELNILMDRPLRVTAVTNPLSPTDAADPEDEEDARRNAPLPMLTLDRIVSLTDYENFARAFAGIGKANAIWIWDGQKRIVYLTIASEIGLAVEPSSALYQNLVTAIDNYKDPTTRFKIGAPILKIFNVRARILISNGFEFENVKVEVEEVLRNKFSFDARDFGQHVTISEVISVIQNVDGVLATDIDYLYLTEESPKLKKLIPSKISHWDGIEKKVVPAEILTINSVFGGGGITIMEMTPVT